ncbi:MAG: cell division ATP-binding protein FtsE, partial [Clostridia bacterium]|nr:cell division ATP-binding protein FtsE [Clostridia bacterium]
MIEFSNVSKMYGDCVALDNASLKIDEGEFVFVVGPSGAGKSTFIKLMLRQIQPDEGEICINGRYLSTMSNREIPMLRREIGMVFQDFRLLPNKTVFENVAFAMEVVHSSQRLINRQVPQILEVMGIADAANRFPDELSGGEQQRVAIARAIINNPKILIADEPTGNLDKETAKEIMSLIDMINHRGTTVVMVTHATDIVERMGKRVIAIDNGRIIADRRRG